MFKKELYNGISNVEVLHLGFHKGDNEKHRDFSL
jgi:hypothetical protein